ncbi:MAG: hypothetical protein OEY11_04540 [Gammaproteobacteria bacterium]|nr:hypothetical protein [Gammaproteobacteria bacterium]
MAAWIPLIKTALPYVVQVVSIAIPAFTSKADDNKNSEIIHKQISELQSAVTQNAESVKILAEQLKGTIEGIDTAALKIQQEVALLKRLCLLAIIIASVSVVFALASVLTK